jgi:hypothetical protein
MTKLKNINNQIKKRESNAKKKKTLWITIIIHFVNSVWGLYD